MEDLSFEESIEKLEEIVERLESGDVPLDDAIDEFNNAMQLVKICDEKLTKAEESIAKIVDENGELMDFDVDAQEN
ncbi:MAG: exodeoxyribonuclease VII small subunit [Methanosphaera sp.]|nr:exodeoxyribonuclease VII small subunit [Methanosphaera sp.]